MYRADVFGHEPREKARNRMKTILGNASVRKQAHEKLAEAEQVNQVRKNKDYVTSKTIQYLKEGLS
jgi:hypothetical protein